MLKVVHLNTYDGNGGAGRACMRLNRALLSQNIDSKIIVHYKFGKNKQIGDFNTNLLQKAHTAATIILERMWAKRYLKAVKTPFSFAWFGRSVINHPDIKSADIIHLHWVNHGFLNPKHIAEIAKLNKTFAGINQESGEFYAHLELAQLAVALKKRVILIQAVEHAQHDPQNPFENFVQTLKADQQRVSELESAIEQVMMRLSKLELDRARGFRDKFFTPGEVERRSSNSTRTPAASSSEASLPAASKTASSLPVATRCTSAGAISRGQTRPSSSYFCSAMAATARETPTP